MTQESGDIRRLAGFLDSRRSFTNQILLWQAPGESP